VLSALHVALGGAVGTLLRYWCSGLVAAAIGETFPWGTLTVNVIGSTLIGLFAALVGPDGRLLLAPDLRQAVMIGMFGGFTTFSSFSLQTLALIQDDEWLFAAGNVLLSVALCLGGVWLGWSVGALINR
jgi:fluoride exporter